VSSKDTGVLASALGDLLGSATGLLSGSDGVSQRYSSLISSDEALLELARLLMKTPGFAAHRKEFEEQFHEHVEKAKSLGLVVPNFETWFAGWCAEQIDFLPEDANVVAVRVKASSRKLAIEILNESLYFAKDYLSKREASDINMAQSYLRDKIAKIEGDLDVLAARLLDVRSMSQLAGALSPTGFYDTGIGTLRADLDQAVSQLEENIRVIRSIKDSNLQGEASSVDSRLQVQEIERSNGVLRARIDTLKSQLERKQGDKEQLLKQINTVESATRQIEILATSYQRLQEQALKIDLLAMTVANRFQITAFANLERVRPVIPPSVAVLLGSLLLAMLVLSWDLLVVILNPRVVGRESVARFEPSFVAYIPNLSGAAAKGIILHKGTQAQFPDFSRNTPGVKALLALRRSVQTHFSKQKDAPSDAKLVLVSGPNEGCGKSTIANGLALTMAQSGDRVLLVDMDPYHPQVSQRYDIEGQKGLFNYLASRSSPSGDEPRPHLYKAQFQSSTANSEVSLDILPVGHDFQSFSRAHQENLRTLMDDLRKRYDYIVVDLPPLLEAFEFSTLHTLGDLTLLVCHHNDTSLKHLEESYEALPASVQKKTALLVNRIRGGLVDTQTSSLRTSSYYYRKKIAPGTQDRNDRAA